MVLWSHAGGQTRLLKAKSADPRSVLKAVKGRSSTGQFASLHATNLTGEMSCKVGTRYSRQLRPPLDGVGMQIPRHNPGLNGYEGLTAVRTVDCGRGPATWLQLVATVEDLHRSAKARSYRFVDLLRPFPLVLN